MTTDSANQPEAAPSTLLDLLDAEAREQLAVIRVDRIANDGQNMERSVHRIETALRVIEVCVRLRGVVAQEEANAFVEQRLECLLTPPPPAPPLRPPRVAIRRENLTPSAER